MVTYTLYDLNEHVRRVLALNFREPLWITAEIGACKNSRGHIYLDLLQKGEEELLAQAQAVLWERSYHKLRLQHGRALDEVLREGLELRLQVRVDFHERYGLKLVVEDVDTAFALGKLAIQRRQTVEILQREGFFALNKSLKLPLTLQRIAVLSSKDAAGWQDFRVHLEQNPFGYVFQLTLFPVALQGERVALEMPAALATIARRSTDFDALAVVRGGGARLDLGAFDHPDIARALARMPLPVFTGIGHDIDETVADMVAFRALKTPTAVADFLIQHQLVFENGLLQHAETLRYVAQQRIQSAALELQRADHTLLLQGRQLLKTQTARLDNIEAQLPQWQQRILRTAQIQLDHAEKVCHALHPDTALQRGYSITRKNGKVVTDASELAPGDVLETTLKKGRIWVKAE